MLKAALEALGELGLPAPKEPVRALTGTRADLGEEFSSEFSQGRLRFDGPGLLALWVILRSLPPGEDELKPLEIFQRRNLEPEAPMEGIDGKWLEAPRVVLVASEEERRGRDLGRIVEHELVHAIQTDREVGWNARHSVEERHALWVLSEGEAELYVLAVHLSRSTGLEPSESLGILEPDELALDARVLDEQSNTMLGYDAGVHAALRIHRAGGVDALRRAYEDPGRTAEHFLFPNYVSDRPVAPPRVCDWPADSGHTAELVHSDVLGILGVRLVLRELAGFEVLSKAVLFRSSEEIEQVRRITEAWLGWDGDRLHVWRLSDGTWAFAWRTLWDREIDAEQFMAALPQGAVPLATRRGRAVDWIWAEKSSAREVLAQAMTDIEPRPPSAESSSDAQRLEAYVRKTRESVVADGVWAMESPAVSLELPSSWPRDQSTVRKDMVIRSMGAAGTTLMHLERIAVRVGGAWPGEFEALVQSSLDQLDPNSSSRREAVIDGVEGVWIEGTAEWKPSLNSSLRWIAVWRFHVDRPTRFVTLEGTLALDRSEAERAAVRNCLATAKLPDAWAFQLPRSKGQLDRSR